MNRFIKTTAGVGAMMAACLAVYSVVPALEAPDSGFNPQTGSIEVTLSVWDGSKYRVRHSINPGNGKPEVIDLGSSGFDELRPRLEFNSAGDTWIVWWRDTAIAQVFVRKRSETDKTWGAERRVSVSTESSKNPSIAYDGTDVWVGFEFEDQGSRSIGVGIINDDPDPVGLRSLLGTTDFTQDLDVLVHADGGQLWTTWIDNSTEVGWSAYDSTSDSWSLAAYESYAADDVDSARQRIQDAIQN